MLIVEDGTRMELGPVRSIFFSCVFDYNQKFWLLVDWECNGIFGILFLTFFMVLTKFIPRQLFRSSFYSSIASIHYQTATLFFAVSLSWIPDFCWASIFLAFLGFEPLIILKLFLKIRRCNCIWKVKENIQSSVDVLLHHKTKQTCKRIVNIESILKKFILKRNCSWNHESSRPWWSLSLALF